MTTTNNLKARTHLTELVKVCNYNANKLAVTRKYAAIKVDAVTLVEGHLSCASGMSDKQIAIMYACLHHLRDQRGSKNVLCSLADMAQKAKTIIIQLEQGVVITEKREPKRIRLEASIKALGDYIHTLKCDSPEMLAAWIRQTNGRPSHWATLHLWYKLPASKRDLIIGASGVNLNNCQVKDLTAMLKKAFPVGELARMRVWANGIYEQEPEHFQFIDQETPVKNTMTVSKVVERLSNCDKDVKIPLTINWGVQDHAVEMNPEPLSQMLNECYTPQVEWYCDKSIILSVRMFGKTGYITINWADLTDKL